MGEIKKQSINNTIFSYIGAIIGFVSLIYIQPYFLGSENIGLIRLIYSFSWMVAMIMPLGMGNIAMKFFPQFKNDENKHNGFFGLLLLLVSFGAFIILALFLGLKPQFMEYYQASPKFTPYYYYCFVYAYILALISVFNIYSGGLMKTTFTVFLTDVYTRLGFIVIIFLYYFKWIDEAGLVISYVLIYIIQLILLIIYLIRLNAISLKINWKFYRQLDKRYYIVFAVVMTFGSFASLGVKFIDSLILGHYIDNIKIIGVYSVCAFIPTIMEIPFNSLDRIAQPKVAYAWHHNHKHEVHKIYEMSSRYLYFIGGALFCALYAGADFIFMTLPPEYEAGKTAFLILSVSSLFNLMTGVNTTIITLSQKYFVTSTLLIILIGIAIVCNILLIPVLGISGAATATFIAITCFNILKYIYIAIRFKMQPFSSHTIYISLAILISISMIYFIPDSFHPFLKALTGGIITLVVFIIFNMKCNTIVEINEILKRYKVLKS